METENTRLLKEGQSNLEKMNAVYDQLLHEQTALQKANGKVQKLEEMVDEAHRDQELTSKLATEALNRAEEARKKEEEATRLLAESIATFEEEKGNLAQQGYNACYDELVADYTKMADESYTNGYEEAYRLAWREALKAAGVAEGDVLFKEESIVWPSSYTPKPYEDDAGAENPEAVVHQAVGDAPVDATEDVAAAVQQPVAEVMPPPAPLGPSTDEARTLDPTKAAAVIPGVDVHMHGVDVIVSHNNPSHGVPPSA